MQDCCGWLPDTATDACWTTFQLVQFGGWSHHRTNGPQPQRHRIAMSVIRSAAPSNNPWYVCTSKDHEHTRFVVCWSPLPSSLCSECSVGIEEQCGGRCQKGQKGTKKARHTPHSQDATAALNWGRDPYPRKPPAIKTVAVAKPRTRLIVLAGLMVVILSNVPGFQLKPSMPRTLPGL